MIYQQSTGILTYDSGSVIATGYAGHGEGKNNPAMQNVEGVGPLPCGGYAIGEPIDKSNTGPFSLPLIPDATNEMFGRSGFYMHGGLSEPFTEPDGKVIQPGQESDGCTIFPREIRELVWNDTEHRLTVIP
jgi:hypothetical protein